MKSIVLLIMLFGIGWSPSEKVSQSCFSYESNVNLEGKISRQTFPGRPNFESIEKGDEPETYWVLQITKPVCVNGDEKMPNGESVEKDVTGIQLVLDQKQYAEYKDLVGKKVIVNGKLFHAISGHHHTNVLMKVADIKGEPR